MNSTHLLLLAIAIASRTVLASHCSGNWDFAYENEVLKTGLCCYIVSDNMVNWHEAALECKKNVGHLVEITTWNHQHVKEIAKNADLGKQHVLWIGANDILQEGKFIWKFTDVNVDTGYTSWCNGTEPMRDTSKNCLALVRNFECSKHWSMEPRDCSEQHRFLCEKLPDLD